MNMKINDIKEISSTHLLLGVLCLMALLTLTTLCSSIYQWQKDWYLTHHNNAVATTPTKIIVPDKPLADAHLFGTPAQINDMPISNLQLRVLGISKATDHHGHSKVLLSISGNPGKVFKIGDHLPYGVTVYDITANAVILENNGLLEKVPLPRPLLEFKAKFEREPAITADEHDKA